MAHFDLVIIGTGVAGRTAAEEAAAAGLKAAIVERRAFGGTCALRGCEPKRILFAGAEPVERVRAQRGQGVSGDARVDWSELIGFKRGLIDPTPAALESYTRGLGLEVLHGTARFTGPDRIDVDGAELTADAFLVATGAKPMPLGISGEELIIDSEAFMQLEDMPARVVFIGGGFISFEFAPMVAATGARATILHRSEMPLKEFDPDMVRLIVAEYAEQDIDVRLSAPVSGVSRDGDALAVQLASGERVACDLVVHGAGRVPDLSALDLETAGVTFGPRGIEVDANLRSTSNPRVFAAGDAAALGAPLTPVGVAEARVAVRTIVDAGAAPFRPAEVPSAAFTSPPIASVGMSADEAARVGDAVTVKVTDTSQWLSSKRVGLRHTGAKTMIERASGRILGAHVVGHNAEELVNVFALAIASGTTTEQLKAMLWAYPTTTSEIVYLV